MEMRPNSGKCSDVLVTASCWAVALLFLITALLKAVTAARFAQTIVSYGFPHFQFMAPVIIEIEVLLALFLIFRIHTKWTALAGAVMIIGFTVLYTYAFVFRGITDCGCFGGFSALNNSPVVFYVKNVILLALLVFIFLKAEDCVPHTQWIYAVIIIIVGAVGVQSGLTYETVHYRKLSKPIAVKDSPLHEFVQTSPDSTYAVFAFSYTCPHCMNSIGNLKEYEKFGVADRVVGLALGDSLSREFFFAATRPNFTVYTHGSELFKLTTRVPRLYYIARDSILYESQGEAPAAFILNAIVSD